LVDYIDSNFNIAPALPINFVEWRVDWLYYYTRLKGFNYSSVNAFSKDLDNLVEELVRVYYIKFWTKGKYWYLRYLSLRLINYLLRYYLPELIEIGVSFKDFVIKILNNIQNSICNGLKKLRIYHYIEPRVIYLRKFIKNYIGKRLRHLITHIKNFIIFLLRLNLFTSFTNLYLPDRNIEADVESQLRDDLNSSRDWTDVPNSSEDESQNE